MTGVKVSDFIRPLGIQDTYPSHLDNFGKGGIHSAADILTRDAITNARRSQGMFAFTQANQGMYALMGGVENSNWQKLFDFTDNQVNFNIACDPNYVLLGDKDGLAKPSPSLLDAQYDIIDLRRRLDKLKGLDRLTNHKIWIGNNENRPEETLQIGIVNLPTLEEALFPNPLSSITGDFRIPNPTFDYLSPFDWVMSGPFLPQIYATKYDAIGNPIGAGVSSSLAMTQVKAAQIIKRFDNANFIVGSSTVEFGWENPKMLLIPEEIKQIYGLGTTYTFTKAQSLGALETGLLKNTVDNGTGTLSKAIAGKDYVDLAAPIADMKLALIRPMQQDEQGNDIAKLLIRADRLPEDNMPDLTFIMQRPSSKIPSGQGLSDLAPGGILKSNPLGAISIASGGKIPLLDDYVTPLDLQTEIIETKTFATAEAAAAEAAAIAASTAYFTYEMLPYLPSPIPGTGVGFQITAAIGIVGIAAAQAQSTANQANTRIDNLTVNLVGDVIGSNNISDPIVTLFTPNPRFTGQQYMKIPTGIITERPSNQEAGMIRCITEN